MLCQGLLIESLKVLKVFTGVFFKNVKRWDKMRTYDAHQYMILTVFDECSKQLQAYYS